MRPHSEHSLSAIRSLVRIGAVIMKIAGSDDDVEGRDVAAMCMSVRASTVLATTFGGDRDQCYSERTTGHELTIGLLSAIISCNCSRKPLSMTSSGFRS